MDDNRIDGERTNLLGIPASQYQALDTEAAYAKFNSPKRSARGNVRLRRTSGGHVEEFDTGLAFPDRATFLAARGVGRAAS